jgi:hypothetical protein
MNGAVIVWDLETVPDLPGFAAANGLSGKTDDEIGAAIGNKFPKHIYHSIVCIGALVAYARRSLGATSCDPGRASFFQETVLSKSPWISF